ncbi:prephenate dehydrogenase [Galbitalea sp. SE-J8]|uniref:prephenate dehydrogenase n=1 Tax=Galbitalea sp. SE-J8 TaxID=3054952 RepID=UPI00259C7B08|nr:prephenate dehydrogenase [Galbitalea sp. SE-J8]MDM4764301.1 prephenate dehydrogenase [Galbitalea sp. SE-J8]
MADRRLPGTQAPGTRAPGTPAPGTRAPGTRVRGPVRIVGAGLLGASIGLRLTELGVDVALDDASPTTLRLAIDYGAGRATAPGDQYQLVVVAVPPDVTAATVAAELAAHPEAMVTDVASVKSRPLAELRALGADVGRYLGSHPMAGRERGGAVSARADLFVGRPWVLAGHDGVDYRAAAAVEQLALDLGAVPVEMDVASHDASVALVSHVPQVVASLLAARLEGASDAAVALAGQGLRDTTRIAASAPELWVQILAANAEPVASVLRALRDDLDAVITAVDDPEARGARRVLAEAIAQGNAGVARIPGKHGGTSTRFASVIVLVDDRPGELARLLTQIGEFGINMEDLRLEHAPGRQVGLAEIAVLPEVERDLVDRLVERGWRIAGESR